MTCENGHRWNYNQSRCLDCRRFANEIMADTIDELRQQLRTARALLKEALPRCFATDDQVIAAKIRAFLAQKAE